MDEQTLRTALARDLDGSFEALVSFYQDRLFRFALRLAGSPQDAEEIAQDAFVRAYRALDTYPPERIRSLALQAWLYRITLNVCRNRMRARRLTLASLNGDIAENPERGPEQAAEAAEQTRELAGLLLSLPDRYRAAVVLRHVEELSYGEIAAVLGQPEGTVKSGVHRGREMLRAMLAKQEVMS